VAARKKKESALRVDDPWYWATEAKRTYLTPEDVTKAKKNGASRFKVYAAVLQAVERRSAEDASCCAFVALKDEDYREGA
jgi:hypothetical protein